MALQSWEQARDVVHQPTQPFALLAIDQQKTRRDLRAGPSGNVNLHATLIDDESMRRPLLFTRIRHNRGRITMTKADICLQWAARAPPRCLGSSAPSPSGSESIFFLLTRHLPILHGRGNLLRFCFFISQERKLS